VVDLAEVLTDLALERAGLVEAGVLIGTDYNPGGVRGIGPKRALSLIKRHGSLEEALSEIDVDDDQGENLMRIRGYYLDPPVDISWNTPAPPMDREGTHRYLVEEKKLGSGMARRLIELTGSRPAQSAITDWT
jgi:flap endonuclease-1